MRHADHFGFPILTFVDTPGAFAGKAAEEQGQVLLLSQLFTCLDTEPPHGRSKASRGSRN